MFRLVLCKPLLCLPLGMTFCRENEGWLQIQSCWQSDTSLLSPFHYRPNERLNSRIVLCCVFLQKCGGFFCFFFWQPDSNLNTDSQSLKVQCVGFKAASSDEVADYNQLNSPSLNSLRSILGYCRWHLSLYTTRWGWVVFSQRKTYYRRLFINNAPALLNDQSELLNRSAGLHQTCWLLLPFPRLKS